MTVNELIAALQALVAENEKAGELAVAVWDGEYSFYEEVETVAGVPLSKSDSFSGRAGYFRYGSGECEKAKPKAVIELST